MRRNSLQGRNQVVGCWWCLDLRFRNNSRRRHVLAVQAAVGVIIWAERRAFQRHAGKCTSRAGITQHFRAEGHIGRRLRVATLRTGCYGGVSTELYLAVKQTIYAARVHHQDNEVGCLPTDLEAYATSLQGHHCWSPPGAGEILSGPADHCAAPVAAADNKCGLHHRREHNYAT